MRKAIFINKFDDTITIDEILAPTNICSELTLAVDEDVDNSDDIEAICGEEIAGRYRERLENGDYDAARDIIDTEVYDAVDSMDFDQQVQIYTGKSRTLASGSTASRMTSPSRSVRAPESPKFQPRTDSPKSKRRTTARNITKSQPTASATTGTAKPSTIRIVSRGPKVTLKLPDSPTSTRRTNPTTSVSIPATRNGEPAPAVTEL